MPKPGTPISLATGASRRRSPASFFLFVFVLTIPFVLLGAANGRVLIPGVPLSALGSVCPATAAAILRYREGGVGAATELLRRAFDYRRIRAKRWYLPILLLMPGAMLLTYALMHVMGSPHPPPRFTVPRALVLLAAFFVAALGEELGWSAYALGPLQSRWNALHAGIVLGAVWAAWHVVTTLQADQSQMWLAWAGVNMVATRVLLVWLYNNTGRSVFAVTLAHAIASFGTWSLFPGGSSDAERILTMILIIAAATVTVVWGPRTLARGRAR